MTISWIWYQMDKKLMTSTSIPKRSCQISAPFTMVNVVSFITIHYLIIYTLIEFGFLKRYFHSTLSPFLQFSNRLFLTSGQANSCWRWQTKWTGCYGCVASLFGPLRHFTDFKNINRIVMSKRVRQVTCNPFSSVLIKKH